MRLYSIQLKGEMMRTTKVEKDLMKASIDKFKLQPTSDEDVVALSQKCDSCRKPLIALRLNKSQKSTAGFMPSVVLQ
jgi:hypothetical protein